jgi:SAM-dependent methyltransferase
MPDAMRGDARTTGESEFRAVQRTLESKYSPPAIADARARQDSVLLQRFEGKQFRFADIGCGNGYHAVLFAGSSELYHGFEISPDMAVRAQDRWERAGLTNAHVFVGDVAEADLPVAFYDVAMCLYFTPGNLRDKSDDLALYTDAYLDRNPCFVRVMSRFICALRPGGSLFLTVYRDTPETEAAQFDFYEKTGQHPVTPRGGRFVATAEGFWSARWTEKSVLSNLAACGVSPGDATFTELNAIAWLVEAKARA